MIDPTVRYKKGETLGEGTFGTVYKATDNEVCELVCSIMRHTGANTVHATQTGQLVAIKRVHLGKAKEVGCIDASTWLCHHQARVYSVSSLSGHQHDGIEGNQALARAA